MWQGKIFTTQNYCWSQSWETSNGWRCIGGSFVWSTDIHCPLYSCTKWCVSSYPCPNFKKAKWTAGKGSWWSSSQVARWKSEVDERAPYSDSTKPETKTGNKGGRWANAYLYSKNTSAEILVVAALEGRQRDNYTPMKTRADSEHSNSSLKDENEAAPAPEVNNWSKNRGRAASENSLRTGKRTWCNALSLSYEVAPRAGWGN